MRHILSAKQFDQKIIAQLFDQANDLRKRTKRPLATNRIIATLFYEPSTRTRLSFESAAQKLGYGIISTESASEYSSAIKGETVEDTIRTVSTYADAIVLRHKIAGAAEAAASVSSVPVINAGDGAGEHPTQALLDLYTIHLEKGRLDNLQIVLGGDLAHGRTARSLAQLLGLYKDNQLLFVSTPELRIGAEIKAYLDKRGVRWYETDDIFKAVADADVVYWTRLQKERLADPNLESSFTIDTTVLNNMPKDSIVMHPLPRVYEIATEVDVDPRAAYFRQVENGLYIRMALLEHVLEGLGEK